MEESKQYHKHQKASKRITEAKQTRNPKDPWPKGIMVKGTLRCPTCDSVLKPKHNVYNCCKSAFRQYMKTS